MIAARGGTTGHLVLALVVAASLAGARPGEGHEKHRKPVTPATDSPAADSSVAGAGAVAGGEAGGRAATAAGEAVEPPFEMPPMEEMVVHHLHNKLIHLPIVLAPVALVLLLAERRRQGAGATALLFVWGAALSSVAAFFTGRAQAGAFDDGPKEWLVGTHETWGIVTMIVLLVWAVAASWPRTMRHAWIIGTIGTVAVLVTAMYGGLVAHG